MEVLETSDNINDNINPSHYKYNGIQAIDYMEAISTKEEFLGHCKLTAIKYISRAGKKHSKVIEEIDKAVWYLTKYKERFMKEE